VNLIVQAIYNKRFLVIHILT